MAQMETTMPANTTMYGPPEGSCVCETLEPIQIHPNGITVHIEKAPSTITATTSPAAAPKTGLILCARCSTAPAGYGARDASRMLQPAAREPPAPPRVIVTARGERLGGIP